MTVQPPSTAKARELGIDLVDMAFWDRPHEARLADFARLRALETPVYFAEPRVPFIRAGKGFHALVRHADVVEASRNAKVFSSEPAATSPEPPPWLAKLFGTPMINMDDPAHARLRRIVFRAFTPRTLAKIEDEVQAIATRIVDRVVEEGPRDFVGQVSAPFQLAVICAMMGIPEKTRPYVLSRVDAMTEYSGVRGSLASPRTLRLLYGNLTAIVDLHRLVARLGRIRRERPADDLVSALVNANPDGERLSIRELGSFFDLLLVAGNETTRNTLTHGLKLFTDHPDQRDLLLADYDTHIGGAIEELVRYVSPIIQFRRTVTTDYELGGHPFRAGDKVVLFYPAANRDPAAFKDPDVFDITREPNKHVAFGGPGPHLCLGANLARMELKIMFRELFTRLPGLRAAGEPDYLLSNFDNGITRLPFTFSR
ncbi:cytochrome P450 [Actinomadura rudentiformis]|uniref:Cytochrome P450 n=1 Tax=Actinomadura rudentiformis TaxID=359158 RepID=A0A6H9YAQ5_9ACTN|nr:cytochrome P450 [Actinomadura rudentiformis]KAB2342361.1 cytochrome P450 [Actinomadura rudentiformis]